MSTEKKGLRLPPPDGLTLEERIARMAPEERAELEAYLAEMQRAACAVLEAASRTARGRAMFAVLAIGTAARGEDPDPVYVWPAVRGVLRDLADANPRAAAALEEPGGAIRDRLARLVMARARELWAELDKRTEAELGESWGALRRWWEEGPEPDLGVLARLGELMAPAPWSAEVAAVLAWDAWLAEWLEAKGAAELAVGVRKKAERRAAACEAGDAAAELWA